MKKAVADAVRNVFGAPGEHGLRDMARVTVSRLFHKALVVAANVAETFSIQFHEAIDSVFQELSED